MNNTTWIVGFCNDYADKALWLAELFIYLGLPMGVAMAVFEAYKVYREARAVAVTGGGAERVTETAAAPAVGEVLKAIVGIVTAAKAWLALVLIGIVLFWLAGNAVPDYCKPPQQQPAQGGARSSTSPQATPPVTTNAAAPANSTEPRTAPTG